MLLYLSRRPLILHNASGPVLRELFLHGPARLPTLLMVSGELRLQLSILESLNVVVGMHILMQRTERGVATYHV